eukprot:SAG31_NODE_8216_length_1494_cov_2.132616_1_plen_137_part_10
MLGNYVSGHGAQHILNSIQAEAPKTWARSLSKADHPNRQQAEKLTKFSIAGHHRADAQHPRTSLDKAQSDLTERVRLAGDQGAGPALARGRALRDRGLTAVRGAVGWRAPPLSGPPGGRGDWPGGLAGRPGSAARRG